MTQNHAQIEEISDMLINCKMFDQLQASELLSVAQYFGISNHSEGKSIFNEGDKGTFMCIVHEGRVSVEKIDNNGDVVVMGTEGVGHAFGEMAVLDCELRSATCMAETDCVLLTLSKNALNEMLDEKPRIGAKILRAIAISLSRRMRFSAGRLVDYLGQT
jgi:CRP-like cAMP-binding protein